MNKIFTLKNIRRLYALFFCVLFFALIYITSFKDLKGYEVALFLELDPLTAVATFFTSYTVYRGLILALIIIVGTLLLGRFFCSWICPLGTINQVASSIFNKLKPVDAFKANSYQPSFATKYYILAFLLCLSLFGSLQTGILDPIALITRSFSVSLYPAINYFSDAIYLKQPYFYGGIVVTAVFVLILFANRFVSRFWCRALCPLGAFLGLMAFSPILAIRRDAQKCTNCKKCLTNCHGACDPHATLKTSECMLCMNCIDDCPEGAIHFGLPKATTANSLSFDINRRRLIETTVAGLITVPMLKTSVNAYNTSQAQVIRPPGSLDEKDFLKRCLKCGQCMKVCPTNALQPALFEAGFEGLWTPIVINKIGYCEQNCVLCGQVCPTGAIMPITLEQKIGTPDKKPIKIGTAFYDHGRCLPWSMHIDCIVCEEVCPTSPKAIWFEHVELKMRDGSIRRFKRPYVDVNLCTGCGICENKCPVKDKPAIRVSSIGETRSKVNKMILKERPIPKPAPTL